MNTQPPLNGIRVLDLTRVVAGPWGTMMLGDMGAEVTKVESPDGGDYTRAWGTALPAGESPYFLAANRNKRSICIDFSTADGQALVRELVLQSDVLVENYVTGALDKHGLGWSDISRLNPRLIYCSISGYGRSGPMAHRPGYDPVIQGESGFMSVTGEVDGRPMKIGVPLADIMTGMYAAYGVMSALMTRNTTGRGQLIDISLLDCALANLGAVGANALLLNQVPGRYGNGHADVVPFEMYPTSDGHLNLAVGNDSQFLRLCSNVLGRPDLAESSKFRTNEGRRKNRVELDAVLAECFQQRTRVDWLRRLEEENIPAGAVRNALEALNSPEAIARGMVSELDHASEGIVRLVAFPIKRNGASIVEPMAPPTLGQHTDEVLIEKLGLSAQRLEALRSSGVIA